MPFYHYENEFFDLLPSDTLKVRKKNNLMFEVLVIYRNKRAYEIRAFIPYALVSKEGFIIDCTEINTLKSINATTSFSVTPKLDGVKLKDEKGRTSFNIGVSDTVLVKTLTDNPELLLVADPSFEHKGKDLFLPTNKVRVIFTY